MVMLNPKEMDALVDSWKSHRRTCEHQGDAKLEHLSGGGIGTRTQVTCGCGKKIDVTDYSSW
jgi:hypothetical protein